MQRSDTPLPGVVLLQPQVFADQRGFFLESYNARTLADLGIEVGFVQDNHSRSLRGVVRGLHYQLHRPQVKLIRVTAGAVWDVAVDLRRGSPTFGRWWGVELSASNYLQVLIPGGFGHGFCVLSEAAEVQYKCSDYYDPADERGVAWNDPQLQIPWPLGAEAPVVSARDAALPTLATINPEDLPPWQEAAWAR